MSFKETLHKKLIVITYHLTTEQMLRARFNRDWENYDELEEIDKLHHQLEELSIYEDILEDIDENTMSEVMREIYNKRF